ncbi:Rrf2 family transcriptional regulator [Oceanicaulis sp. HTCC2633]|uniref:RrF2 family transcriptional regulator n=1 Tax=Oceanicaulis sp. HTCC2633 TaxID=314254 RepID=UPI0002D3246A|nr:Rrf2 family transcriptional regulator [Oceanicaulis sp. HTCC2633]
MFNAPLSTHNLHVKGCPLRLTNFSNFALRLLQFAALHAPNLIRTEDVARAHGISRHHLLKAVNTLEKEGFIKAVRGRNGGITLNRPAEDVTVGEVIRITEAPLELVECFNAETNTCPLIGVCHLSASIQTATRAFLAVLDDVTIADIAANRSVLLSRLNDAEIQ